MRTGTNAINFVSGAGSSKGSVEWYLVRSGDLGDAYRRSIAGATRQASPSSTAHLGARYAYQGARHCEIWSKCHRPIGFPGCGDGCSISVLVMRLPPVPLYTAPAYRSVRPSYRSRKVCLRLASRHASLANLRAKLGTCGRSVPAEEHRGHRGHKWALRAADSFPPLLVLSPVPRALLRAPQGDIERTTPADELTAPISEPPVCRFSWVQTWS